MRTVPCTTHHRERTRRILEGMTAFAVAAGAGQATVLCAWCPERGRHTALARGDGGVPISYGICP